MTPSVRLHRVVALLVTAGSASGAAWWGAAGALASARAGTATFEELVVISCAVLAWVCCVWIASVVVLMAATAAPGVVGRIATRWCMALVPAIARHTVRSALGLVALAAPIAAAAPVAATPATTFAAAFAEQPSPTTLPDVGRPPVGPPDDSAQAADPPDATAGDAAVTITVEPGDSLWAIADHHLGPRATDRQVAAEWPRWFAANRDEIGPDPDHIVPGTMLRAPPGHDAPA